jgi:hypothetical protein
MYKTVRHGENSLQYTILPQQDDTAVVTAANISIYGRSSAGVRRKARRGRKLTILIMALILACGVVGAAVVVPLLVSTDLVAIPSAIQHFSKHKSGHHHAGHRNHHSVSLQKNITSFAQQNTTLCSAEPELTSAEDMATSSMHKLDPTSTNASQPLLPEEIITTTKASVPVTLSPFTEEVTTRATTQQQEPVDFEGLLEENGGAKGHDHVGGSKKKALDQDMRNSTSTIFVSATTVKYNRSVLVLEAEAHPDVGISTERPKHRSWLEPHWPFADPSSYFQWTVSSFILFQHHHVFKCMSLTLHTFFLKYVK